MSKKHPARCIKRAAELGALGQYLLGQLPRRLPPRFMTCGLGGQAKIVLGGAGARYPFTQRLALTLLACDVPLQIEATNLQVATLARHALKPLSAPAPRRLHLGKNAEGVGTYRVKPQPQSVRKVNVRFGDVWRCLIKYEPALASRFQTLSGYTRDLTDDQVAGLLIYARGIAALMDDPVEYAIRAILDPIGAKNLNIVVKGAGLNGTAAGCMLCEATCLQGRGIGSIDLKAEAKKRVGEVGAAGSIPTINTSDLRTSIRQILAKELAGKHVEFQSLDEFWGQRWLWAVNGGHSRIREKYDARAKTRLTGRMHRRAVLEDWDVNPIPGWDGTVYVSSSEKLEHGKTRYIMACDTVSYVAFEHLLRPVERVWRNNRVIIDPGAYGHAGMSDRVLKMSEKGGRVWVMLDYDDFNSQHTLDAQAMVIEELTRMTGYPVELASKLIASFQKMEVYAGPNRVGRATATLMSGHRGTTFLNSVLNAAYIHIGYGVGWDSIYSLHTGDDVVMAVSTFDEASSLVRKVKSTGVRMNPMKQSVGCVTAEFLRVAINRRGSRGYLARAVASCVSGNWVTSLPLSKANMIRHAAQSARTLINRSACPNLPLLLMRSLTRRTGLSTKMSRGVLLGEIAIGDGPSFRAGNMFTRLDLVERKTTVREAGRYRNLPDNATTEYLTGHTTPVEMAALVMVNTSLTESMLDASYGKTLSSSEEDYDSTMLMMKLRPSVPARGSVSVTELLGVQAKKGELQRYPLLAFLKNSLSRANTIELLRLAGVEQGLDPMITAWGTDAHSVVINGVLSYSDASSLGRKTVCGAVHVGYPVAV